MARKKKKIAKTVTDRVAEYRKRMAAKSYKQIAINLPATTIKKLDKLCLQLNTSRANYIDKLITDAGENPPARAARSDLTLIVTSKKQVEILEAIAGIDREQLRDAMNKKYKSNDIGGALLEIRLATEAYRKQNP